MNSLRDMILLTTAIVLSSFRAFGQDVSLNWLDRTAPAVDLGVSFGVPWPKGTLRAGDLLALTSADGKTVPVQSWPLAYWPDGSLKWTGIALSAGPDLPGPLKLSRGNPASPQTPVRVVRTAQKIQIDTGAIQCLIPTSGPFIIESLSAGDREVARAGRLIAILEDRSEYQGGRLIREQEYESQIKAVTVEQSGPVRAVIRIQGSHVAASSGRSWLPFTVRLYFYAGRQTVRMVHTFVFDGDEQKDFIRGLGIAFTVPMREQVQNRHIRFSGEGAGLWAEPVQPLKGRDGRFVAGSDGRDVYPAQIQGKRVLNVEDANARGRNLMSAWAVWDAFKLVQQNADGFTIEKRTNPQSCWLPAGAGRRATGLVFVGDVSGGLAVGVKNFWQSYPDSLEVQKAAGASAELRVWLWSPDAPPMDLRHYDTRAHGLEEVYEDVQSEFSTPNGIARTSELTLYAEPGVPEKEKTALQARMSSQPPLLVSTPEYIHSTRVFGIWSLPDRSTPFKRTIEDQLDATIGYYEKAVDQHHWYGFWDFGDVMHSYDPVRHVWRYDLGGMAWDNTELGTDMWLWYSFLRTGRADIFRMAEAMTRHTSEVDVYHQGRFAGLGSRHNVRHWGCGAKEVRVSQAAYRRFYYYLSTDERTGDVMHEVADADFKVAQVDPMRLASPITEDQKKYPARARGGPDWLAFVGNWMTEWERTGNNRYRDKILAGMDSITKMPYGFRSGRDLLFGYDPATGKLYALTDVIGDYNLATIMGGAEVVFELNELIDHQAWQKTWLQYCRLTSAPRDVVIKDMTTGNEGADGSFARPDRLAGYAYQVTRNPAFARRALTQLMGRRSGGVPTIRHVDGPDVLNPVDEAPGVSTNGAAQSGLQAIELLKMCADQLPESPPKPDQR